MQGGFINTVFALIFAVLLVAIFWGIVTYYAEMGTEEGKREAKSIMIGGITGLMLLMMLYAGVGWILNAAGL